MRSCCADVRLSMCAWTHVPVRAQHTINALHASDARIFETAGDKSVIPATFNAGCLADCLD